MLSTGGDPLFNSSEGDQVFRDGGRPFAAVVGRLSLLLGGDRQIAARPSRRPTYPHIRDLVWEAIDPNAISRFDDQSRPQIWE